jgi:hypothetical protein
MSTGLHLISPSSKGLFHQALMESDPSSYYFRSKAQSAGYGQYFCQLLNCTYVRVVLRS